MKLNPGTLLSAAVFLTAASAYASPLSHSSDRRLAENAPTETCANFSGNWKGKCAVDANGSRSEIDSSTQIEQMKCAGISEEKDFHLIGAVQTKTTTVPALPELGSEASTSVDTSVYRWSPQRDVILFSGHTFSRKINADDPGHGAQLTGKMHLEGDQLLVDGKSVGDQNFSVTCQYRKQ